MTTLTGPVAGPIMDDKPLAKRHPKGVAELPRPLFVAVDPGLAETGVAVFDLEKLRFIGASDRAQVFEVEDVAPALVQTELIRTKPSDSLTTRLHIMATSFRAYLDTLITARGVAVAIELPAITGAYQRNVGANQATRAGIDKLLMATGALVAICPTAMLVRTPGTKKEHKRKVSERIWRAARGEARFPHSDVMDAIFFGGWAIQRSAWLESPA